MSKGQRYPAESRDEKDAASRPNHPADRDPSVDPPPSILLLLAYDQAMRRLIFVSHRTGPPQIFSEDRVRGELVQPTDRPRPGRMVDHPVGMTDGSSISPPAPRAGESTAIRPRRSVADFGGVAMREQGMIGAAMGATALSKSGRWWAVADKVGPVPAWC